MTAAAGPTRPQRPVLIAGGGIGGLGLALTLHQVGVPCVVFEAVAQVQPLGVGINLQPNAVRELFDLGLDASVLDAIGIQAREWALVGRNGKDVYSEPRGLLAGYRWPQYSVHRGRLQMLLYRAVLERLGPGSVQLGHRVLGYRNEADGVVATIQTRDGRTLEVQGSLLVAADGLHSSIRAQMHPAQPPIQWGGAIMWRGTTPGVPIRSGASFVGVGSLKHRVVFYPISQPDAKTGLATINWIAEITVDNREGWTHGDWNRRVQLADFAHHFDGWDFSWLDVPSMLRGASEIFEYPMIDRDPVPTWVDGRVALLGDAAHVMYPVGSNGASQAIVDARVLGAAMVEHGVGAEALQAYDRKLCADISALVLRNRGSGPFGLLGLVDERCGGVFDDIDQVIPAAEREAYMARYKAAAGFAMEALNAAPPTIAPGAKVASAP
ncbi:flavin-dependent oxidoreductase [Ramlibacter sp. USB13]|uniref:Flavin-dependent oxidoreductase n=1 Tax=Ramlibacter cellulosilyticus TaxID=2764187 RepID=A0A923MT07_9BURK|nr:flavin-dependent oxidoreductase [Ramlibacter cellulosilyticus]MBC5784635.1 flavin-dependent oxidoreductase [Ramlibacter cellulosilyticus]